MLLKFVGIYKGERYPLQGNGITAITGEFISFYHKSDYTAIGAARRILRWAEVPDGSPFRHYFEAVEIHANGHLIAEVRGESLYRYLRWPEFEQ